jgi:hypothetical protein
MELPVVRAYASTHLEGLQDGLAEVALSPVTDNSNKDK